MVFKKQRDSKKKNGNGKNQKNFINSENLRGRRPVAGRIAGKDPQMIMTPILTSSHEKAAVWTSKRPSIIDVR
jgi:hypothetical protein